MVAPLFSDAAKTSLSKFFQSHHFEEENLERYADSFQSSEDRFIVIDNFLKEVHLDNIRQLCEEDGEFETVYKLYSEDRFVEIDHFNNSNEEDKFIFEKIYRHPKKERKTAPSVLSDLLLRQHVRSNSFHEFLNRITDSQTQRTGRYIHLKILNQHHFLKKHGDGHPGRTVCMVLYLHKSWLPEYKGRFIMEGLAGQDHIVEPISNRVILFDPNVGTQHEVEPIEIAGKDWLRLNYTIWFYQK